MKAKTILEASDVQGLRSLGAYSYVKNTLEKHLGNKLGVTGWDSLFEKLQDLKNIIADNKEYLLAVCNKNDFNESKAEVYKILKLKISAKDKGELNTKIELLISFFSCSSFDPFEYYEKTKFKKFQNSSKLEGLEIEAPNEETTLESVLAKYRR